MKVAIYIRVSTEEQAKEGYSISAQKQRLKAFCIAQDWPVEGMYVDEGISAKDMNRPDLQRMIKDIESGKINCVLVYRLDRLTRSVLDLYRMLEVFEKHDCKFKSATEVYDTTTAMGRMFITIVAALAQWERENTGERISMGLSEKARQGKYPLTFRPFGYDLDLSKGKLSINTKEAKVVRMIVDLYFKGYGANKICKYLNERNIPTRDGNKWNDKPLMQILKNPLYYGAIRWQDFVVENTHDEIITKDEFKAIQNLISNRRTSDPRRVSSEYIFSGKLKCNNCGYPMVGYYTSSVLASGEKRKYPQYRCLRKKTGECKGSRSVSETKLELAFTDYLGRQDWNEAINQTAASTEGLDINNEKSNIDVTELEKEIEKIDKRKKKWQYAWSDDAMSYEDFKKRTAEADKEIEAIKSQLAEVSTKEEEIFINHEMVIEALMDIRKNWNQLEVMEKKSLVNSIISKLDYEYQDNKLVVKGMDFY
ncbi:recombinase family protein [Cytobacillus solani]|uniref:recombinase family protein n=1 Tax=Cytobacillus solani TaxID=1637975 RepID=UPI00207AE03C|nr:recombinase family protein [Cytobacillus solani]USK56527.1 recombinase family protein [Cytobacillus solani]